MTSTTPRRQRALVAATVALLAASGVSLVTAPTTLAAGPVSGTVTGTVFRDYSADGTRGAREPGESGITLAAFDAAGAPVGTATSAADGTYSLTVTNAATNDLRIELSIPSGKQRYLQPAPLGADNDGDVRFTTLGATGVTFAVLNPTEYCQANPTLVTSCFTYGGRTGAGSAYGTLKSFPYNATGAEFTNNASDTPASLSTFSDVGATFGLAYSRVDGAVFVGAFHKQYSGFGPGGPGAIYRTVGGTTTTFATIPNAGTDSRSGFVANGSAGPASGDPWLVDTSFDAVGKNSLGGMAMTDDGSVLWVVNLADRQLYPVTVATGAVGTPVAVPLATGATITCAAADVRPFALTEHDGLLYLGETCSAQSTQVRTDLAMYLYTFDPLTTTFSAAPVFESAIVPTPHGRGGNACDPAHPLGGWYAWELTDQFQTGAQCAYPQPWLTSVTFDRGNLVLGLRDRFGDQSAEDYPVSVAQPAVESVIAGDLQRACGSPETGWTLESNASCGGITTAGQNDGQGPGNGEYYFHERFTTGTNHQETSNGGVLQVPGFTEVAYTTMDPDRTNGGNWRAGGVHYDDNATGANGHWFQLYDKCDSSGFNCPGTRTKQGTFGKANGLGTLVALCDRAPIEIGNRVWLDADGNGRQDPGEQAIAGLDVTLYGSDGTTVVSSTTTDAEGRYVFSSDPTRTASTGHVYGISAMTAGAQFVVGVATTTTIAPFGAVQLTGANAAAATSTTNSDASAATGKSTVVTLGAAGHNTHAIDIGYQKIVTRVGNYVWVDTNHDGIQNEPPANGVNGVTVTLQTGGGGAVTDVDGAPVGPAVTANDPLSGNPGYYLFPNLPPGSYRAVFSNLPSGFRATLSNAGADDATDSDGLTTGAVTVSSAVTQDLTLDLGLFAPVAVGDFVWLDADGDGVQGGAESGLAGVTVTLLDAGGAAVSVDADGAAITAQVTDTTGHYGFANLVPGTYQVRFTPPDGYLPTVVRAGADRAIDSDGTTATSSPLAANEADLTLDAGFLPPGANVGSVTCDVYVDANRNGVHDAGEQPMANVTVQLLDQGTGAIVASTVTGADGTCRIDGVPPGTYVLHQSQPSGFGSTTTNDVTVTVAAGVVTAAAAYGEIRSALPATGAATSRLLIIAGVFLVVGALLLLPTPRRRRVA